MFEPFDNNPLVQILFCDGGKLEKFRRYDSNVTEDTFCDVLDFLHRFFREGAFDVVQGNEPLLRRGVVEEAEHGLEKGAAQSQGDQPEGEKDYSCAPRFFHFFYCSALPHFITSQRLLGALLESRAERPFIVFR
jgi:hypothetical protein